MMCDCLGSSVNFCDVPGFEEYAGAWREMVGRRRRMARLFSVYTENYAKSVEEAKAFAIDANSLTILGDDYDDFLKAVRSIEVGCPCPR